MGVGVVTSGSGAGVVEISGVDGTIVCSGCVEGVGVTVGVFSSGVVASVEGV